MPLLTRVVARLRAWYSKVRVEHELDDELRAFFEVAVEHALSSFVRTQRAAFCLLSTHLSLSYGNPMYDDGCSGRSTSVVNMNVRP